MPLATHSFFARLRIAPFLFLNAGATVIAVVALAVTALFSAQGMAAAFIIGMAVLVCLLAAGSAWWLTRRFARPLEHAIDAGRRIVGGDLTVKFDDPATGEAAALQQVLGELQDSMGGIVRDTRTGAIAVDTIARLITNDNADLSSRNESQASSHEETAASLEELSATVKNNAANAAQANLLVTATAEQATKGGQVVGRVVETMASIKQSSDKIVDIISVIDGIAFQTNILALNAAVEAARAGEQGRGFAVVASEVRNLAQRSAGAAKEIKALIADSVERVESGTKLVGEAGTTIGEIVTSIQHVAGFMSDIATASQEQSVGIAQVSESITQFDSMINENTTLVENALKSAATLKASAEALAKTAAKFKMSAEKGTADEAVALVKKAVSFATQHGAASLCDEVNKSGSKEFIFKDLYLVVYDPKAKLRAHGTNPHFVGAESWNTSDPDGKFYTRELVTVGMQQGTGWVNYKFAHPVTQEIMKKAAYLERYDDIVIVCGCYAD